MIERMIIVRHGETQHNVDGIAQGWSDSGLSEAGLAQIERLAVRIANLQPTALFCSTLNRAITTAEAISRTTGLKIRTMEELREMNCGQWEGVSFAMVKQQESEYFARWVNDPSLACPEGESFVDVRDRLRRAFAAIESTENSEASRPVIVSHGTAIRIMATELLRLPIEAARRFAQDNAAINMFDHRGERYVLRVWNDTTHC